METSEPIELCHCGKPLHYSDPRNKQLVDGLIQKLGPRIRVRDFNGRCWLVPRHYIALHGLKEVDLPYLGLEEI